MKTDLDRASGALYSIPSALQQDEWLKAETESFDAAPRLKPVSVFDVLNS